MYILNKSNTVVKHAIIITEEPSRYLAVNNTLQIQKQKGDYATGLKIPIYHTTKQYLNPIAKQNIY